MAPTQITSLQQLITLTQSPYVSLHHLTTGGQHYILLGHTWANQACDIIHYRGDVHTVLGFIDLTIAHREQHTQTQFQSEITPAGLYIVNNAAYPGNLEEHATAWSRWLEREGEKRIELYMSCSSSENLVTYIMTGISNSSPIVAITDVIICEFQEIFLKGFASVIAPLSLQFSEKFATEVKKTLETKPLLLEIFEKFKKKLLQPPKISIPNILKKYIDTKRDDGIRPEDVLENKNLLLDISMQFLSLCDKTVVSSLLFSLGLELISSTSIIRLWYDERRGRIPNHVFKREWRKSIAAMLCSVLGTFLGCLVGFRYFASTCHPFYLGFIFNICSRIIGKYIFSQQ